MSSDVSIVGGLGIIVMALILAVATTKLVEDPIRKARALKRSWMATVTACVGLLVVPTVLLSLWSGFLERQDANDLAAIEALSSQSLSEDPQPKEITVADLIPNPSVAKEDFYKPVVEDGCVQTIQDGEVITCEWGNADSDVTVAVIGGSHSQQWVESAREAADTAGARILTYIKSSCVFSADVDSEFEVDSSCAGWNDAALQSILDEQVDLVVTMGTRVRRGEEWIPAGYTNVFQTLSDNGIQVLALRDNPATIGLSPACLESSGIDACTVPRDEIYVPFDELEVPQIPGVTFMDLADTYCPGNMCRANDGLVTIYRDSHHLTSSWVQMRGGIVSDRIIELLAQS